MNITNIKTIKNKIWLAIIAIIFTLTGCVHNKKSKSPKNNKISKSTQTNNPTTKSTINKEEHVITIWVHGTRSVHLQDYIFKNFFYRKMDLHKANEYLEKHNMRKIAKIMDNQKTNRFVFDNFYFFGWTGDLNHKQRKLAAKKLHKALFDFINTYKAKHNVTPKIRLITHSHGGNVALNLGRFNDNAKNKIKIHELILLACPVQIKTAKLIISKTFKKIYSLYSGLDMIQVIDPQGLHNIKKTILKKIKKPLFSQRRFKPQENLSQVKIKLNDRGILHVEFLTTNFALLLPYILQEIDLWEEQESNNTQSYKTPKRLKIFTKKNTIRFNRRNLKK